MKNKLFISGGLLLCAAALCLTIFNLRDESRAGRDAAEISQQIETVKEDVPAESIQEELPEYILNPEMPMPVISVDGNDYIGTIEVPELELSLPVFSEWNYPDLKMAPCRYAGSAYQNDLIIMAHDYKRHFGGLKGLEEGAEVVFIDAEDHEFHYRVDLIEVLEPTAIEEMEAGDWDLTLFTCTQNGEARLTLRCSLVEEPA